MKRMGKKRIGGGFPYSPPPQESIKMSCFSSIFVSYQNEVLSDIDQCWFALR